MDKIVALGGGLHITICSMAMAKRGYDRDTSV
jgi:hypothetical protein